jgi:glycine/D-amino acid oxidase-like deaminating enzyme
MTARVSSPRAASGLLTLCKLQMLRTQPVGSRITLGTLLAAGLTLRHYKAFGHCPTLPALVRRFDAELPQYGRYGIHVMASQNGLGELILGDSHEYGDTIEPFDKQEIEELILAYLRSFLAISDFPIAARWHGVYAKHPTEAFLIAHSRPGVTAVTGVGGAGMTMSFGLAEHVVQSLTEG